MPSSPPSRSHVSWRARAAALAACCRCHIEGYTGTGATTRTFTFTGKPVLLVMLSGYSLTVLHRGFGTAITFLGTTTTFYSSVTWGGDSVTLTRASGGDGIANGQSTAYGLFALLEGN